MDQISFTDAEFTTKKRKTRREKFLEEMEVIVPWEELEAVIEPHYPKAGNGRQPYPLSTMLHIHIMQHWYNMSDPTMEDALYGIQSMRRFAGLSLTGAIPDETTILKFRRRLEKNKIGKQLFKTVTHHLKEKGVLLKKGTIVDATIINALSSTKNKDNSRDPEMHQSKKGSQWYFGLKVHIGVDAESGSIHSLETTPANDHDIPRLPNCFTEKRKTPLETKVRYKGVAKNDNHLQTMFALANLYMNRGKLA